MLNAIFDLIIIGFPPMVVMCLAVWVAERYFTTQEEHAKRTINRKRKYREIAESEQYQKFLQTLREERVSYVDTCR